MPNDSFRNILHHLQETRFGDLAGMRVSGTVPVSERLINEVVASAVPRGAPVREVRVQPLAGNRFSVRLSPRAPLLPAVTLKLDIERQPDLPSSPVLVLRLATMGGLLGIAGAALPIANMLPPGVRLDADRILVDLRVSAAERGAADLLQHVTQLRVSTEEGRVVLHVDFAVD